MQLNEKRIYLYLHVVIEFMPFAGNGMFTYRHIMAASG